MAFDGRANRVVVWWKGDPASWDRAGRPTDLTKSCSANPEATASPLSSVISRAFE